MSVCGSACMCVVHEREMYVCVWFMRVWEGACVVHVSVRGRCMCVCGSCECEREMYVRVWFM